MSISYPVGRQPFTSQGDGALPLLPAHVKSHHRSELCSNQTPHPKAGLALGSQNCFQAAARSVAACRSSALSRLPGAALCPCPAEGRTRWSESHEDQSHQQPFHRARGGRAKGSRNAGTRAVRRAPEGSDSLPPSLMPRTDVSNTRSLRGWEFLETQSQRRPIHHRNEPSRKHLAAGAGESLFNPETAQLGECRI